MRSASCNVVVVAMIALCCSCSREDAQTPAPEPAVPSDRASASIVKTSPEDRNAPVIAEPTRTDAVMTVQAAIAGMPTRYSATFTAQQQLQYIMETREQPPQGGTGQEPGGERASGRYDFQGARLMRYSGDALAARAQVQLEFDQRGALLSEQGTLVSADIDAIRTRAQLLRSHALAQLATRHHQ